MSDDDNNGSIIDELLDLADGDDLSGLKTIARQLGKSLDNFDDIPVKSDQVDGFLDLLDALEGYEPTADIYTANNGDKLVYEIEVPGFGEDELHVSFEQSELTIRGNARKHTYEEQDIDDYEQKERELGGFESSYEIPDNYTSPQPTYRKGVMIVEFDYVETDSGELDYGSDDADDEPTA